MRQANRLIVNVLSLFGRMAFTVGIGMLVTRLLLRWLGEVDYGLVVTLAATGSMLQFVTGALTSSVQRHLAFEIGHGDTGRESRVFSTSWVMFYVIGIGLWIVGQLLAPLVLWVLTIPPNRADAAWWVYQFSLLTLVTGVTATPFQAAIAAYQHLTVQAVVEALTMVTRLAAVLSLLFLPWDKMVTYVGLQLAGFALARWLMIAYCYWRFPAIRPRPRDFHRSDVRRIMSLASWSVLGDLSWRLRMQGGTLLLNIFFGPRVNAGYGPSVQLVTYINSFAQAIRLSVLPAIVGAQAKERKQNVHRLALVAGKYSLLLLGLLFIPVWIAAPEVLRLWLGDRPFPPYTLILTRLVLVWALANVFTVGYRLALLGTGDIGWFSRIMAAASVVMLVVSGVGFYLGAPPWLLPVVTCVAVLYLTWVQASRIGAQIDLPVGRWVREALLPTLAVMVPSTALAGAAYWAMWRWPLPQGWLAAWWLPDDLVRFAITGAAYAVLGLPLIWWVGLADWEREKFLAFGRTALGRLRRKG